MGTNIQGATGTKASLPSSGQTIHYVKKGQGPNPVLLLPGALGTAESDFTTVFDGLDSKGQLTIIGWDPPGYGQSRPEERTWPEDFFKRDADAAAELMRVLKIDKYSVLGWSDGGITGLLLAANHPDKVSKLVAYAANAYTTEKDVELYEKVRDVSNWSDRMRKPMEDLYGVEGFPKLWNQWVEAILRYHNEKGGDICKDALKAIKCPTLVLQGDKDAMVDMEHPEYLKQNISNSRLHIFPGGKHNLHLKYKDDFNRLVEDFLLE